MKRTEREGRPAARRLACGLLAATLLLSGGAAADGGERVVHRERSAYQAIVVTDSASRRCLRFGESADALNQSCRLLAQPGHLAFDYTRAMATMLLLWQPAPQRLLLIGVGGGSLPMALTAARADLQVDAVDIDPAVLRVAQRYFGLRAGPRLRLHAADGRAYVAEALAAGRRYDAILLDAFDADGIPPALFSEAFLRDARALLADGGVLLANTFAASTSSVREAEAAAAVFGAYLDVRAGEGGNRLIVAAGDAKRLPSAQQLLARLPAQRAALDSLGIDDGWVRQLRFAVDDRRPAARPRR